MDGCFFLFIFLGLTSAIGDSDVAFWITKVDVRFFWGSECESEVRVLEVSLFVFCTTWPWIIGISVWLCVWDGGESFFFLPIFVLFLALCLHSVDFFLLIFFFGF